MRQRRPRSLPIRPGRNLARNGWSYLQTSGSVPAPDGPYHDDDDRNDRFRAAAELFRAMGEAPFHDYLLANYQSFAAAFSASENAHGATLMDLSAFLTCLRSDNRDAAAVSWITARFNEWKGYQLARAQGAWRNTSDDATDYYWGSTAPMFNTSMDLVIGTPGYLAGGSNQYEGAWFSRFTGKLLELGARVQRRGSEGGGGAVRRAPCSVLRAPG